MHPPESDWQAAQSWMVRAFALARLATTKPEIPDGLAVPAERAARELEAICALRGWILEKRDVWRGVTLPDDLIYQIVYRALSSCSTYQEALVELDLMCAKKLRQLTEHLMVARQALGSQLPEVEWPPSVKEVLKNGS